MTWSSLGHVPVFISLQVIQICCACFTFPASLVELAIPLNNTSSIFSLFVHLADA